MKKPDTQLSNIVKKLSDEIRERYPNLFHSIGKFQVYKILEDLCKASEKSGIKYTMINGSDCRSTKQVVLKNDHSNK